MDEGRVVASGELQSVLVRTDLPTLAGEEAGSVIHGTVDVYDENDNLTRLRCSGGHLWVPGNVGQKDATVRLRIRASDVSVCRTRPDNSTILNIVPVTIDAIESDNSPSAFVRLAIGEDLIIARVTRRSIRELELRAGDEVFAQIKSVAVRAP